jgi:hypothetical protein
MMNLEPTKEKKYLCLYHSCQKLRETVLNNWYAITHRADNETQSDQEDNGRF